MALTEKSVEVRELYVPTSTPSSVIATELGVDVGTVCRWKAADAERGEGSNWEHLRRIHAVSLDEVKTIFPEGIGTAAAMIKEHPELLLDPKFADAVSNMWFTENRPELKRKMESCWDGIYQELVDHLTSKGLF